MRRHVNSNALTAGCVCSPAALYHEPSLMAAWPFDGPNGHERCTILLTWHYPQTQPPTFGAEIERLAPEEFQRASRHFGGFGVCCGVSLAPITALPRGVSSVATLGCASRFKPRSACRTVCCHSWLRTAALAATCCVLARLNPARTCNWHCAPNALYLQRSAKSYPLRGSLACRWRPMSFCRRAGTPALTAGMCVTLGYLTDEQTGAGSFGARAFGFSVPV